MYFVLKAATWVLMSVTGIIMWFPYFFGRDITIFSYPMHILGVASLAGAVVIHGFLGSLGNPGTIEAMISGKCTRAWAKLQHGKWLKEYDEKNGSSAQHLQKKAAVSGGLFFITRTHLLPQKHVDHFRYLLPLA
jgi:formate dehydrogenase subunit gamma